MDYTGSELTESVYTKPNVWYVSVVDEFRT